MARTPGGTSPSPRLRRGLPADAEACGRICYDAFCAIADQHDFPHDFPSAADPVASFGRLHADPGSTRRRRVGRQLVGSNFLDERSTIAGLGPITVDPGVQNAGVGGGMQRVLDACGSRSSPACGCFRLATTPARSRCTPRSGSTCGSRSHAAGRALARPPRLPRPPGERARHRSRQPRLRAVHGHDRGGEVLEAIREGSASVVEHGGRITGYSTHRRSSGTAWARPTTTEGADRGRAGVRRAGFPAAGPHAGSPLVPRTQASGRPVDDADGVGLYNEPDGAFLPSILY